MDLPVAIVVIAALLAATIGVGFIVRRSQQRPRELADNEAVDPAVLGADGLGERATLLQFSTELCSRCPGVHRMLHTIADAHDGVRHLDVDLTNRPDLATRFRVLQTPTTLILDRHGVPRTRFGGAPGRDVLELELARIIEESAHV